MTRRRGNNRRARRNDNIVTVAQDGDVVGARFDRMVSNMRSNESATAVLVKGGFGITTGANPGGGSYDFGNFAAEDDFVSLAQQFETFKVKAMRFEVFHTNPGSVVPVVMSTFHADGPFSASLNNCIDGEDSRFMDAGAGKQVFYWNARGTQELAYQSTSSFTSFGGIRYFRELGSTNPDQRILTVICTAQIVFRGRK